MAKQTAVPFGRLQEHLAGLAEDVLSRTGVRNGRGVVDDCVVRQWPARAAMETTIRMQGSRAHHNTDWRPTNRRHHDHSRCSSVGRPALPAGTTEQGPGQPGPDRSRAYSGLEPLR